MHLAAPVTVSLGVAEHWLHETAEEWLARADSAMYQSKQRGRNQVTTALPGAAVRRIA